MRERLSALKSRLANSRLEQSTSYVVRFKRTELGGDLYYVPDYARERPACQELLAGRLYEPDTHQLVCRVLVDRPGDMIHAGAFFGDMLPSFSRACPGAVYAFEPVLENYVLAKLCVEQNELRNVALFNAGLGDQLAVGHVDTGGPIHRGGASKLSDNGQVTTLMTIDSLQLRNVSLIQLDVEGSELPALKGAEHTIRRCRPVILVEDNKAECAGYLESLGYERSGEVPGLSIWLGAAALEG